LFKTLANFEPITPLTGEEQEWRDISSYGGEPWWQNIRCSRVFKNADGSAYDGEGVVFYDERVDEQGKPFRTHYTSRESSVPVTFPYTPTTVYRESPQGNY
jgi:hypothetical protein